jgi:hypothetical protein
MLWLWGLSLCARVGWAGLGPRRFYYVNQDRLMTKDLACFESALRLSPEEKAKLRSKFAVDFRSTNPFKMNAVSDAGLNPIVSTDSAPRIKNPELLAKMVIREGKTFVSSALACGYSLATAQKGLKKLIESSRAVAAAIERETASLTVGLDKLKPLAVKRLYEEIVNPRSANGMKAIVIAGRFKETDWFVRNSDVNVGVFMGLAEAPPDPAIEVLESYKDET